MLDTKNNSQLILKTIEALFGEEVGKYVLNKTTGGQSNLKGGLYEDIFAATQIARTARKYFESRENPSLAMQAFGFVDDFVISNQQAQKQKAFQLKNSSNVSWTGNKHSIEDDFLKQYMLSQNLGYNDIRLSLVVSDFDCVKKLTPPPASISMFSTVTHFPYDEVIHKLLSEHEEIRSDFGFLARHEAFSIADCEQVAQVLIGAWIANERSGDLISLINRARKVSPTVIRPLRSNEEAFEMITATTRDFLDKLEGFSYSIERGFISWSAFGTKGCLSYDCFDSRFSDFQAKLSKKSPQTFDEIEGWLI